MLYSTSQAKCQYPTSNCSTYEDDEELGLVCVSCDSQSDYYLENGECVSRTFVENCDLYQQELD